MAGPATTPEPSFVVSLPTIFDTATLDNRLSGARCHAGLRQEDVARLLGVHRSAIRDWETARHRPRRHAIEEIERVIRAARSERAIARSKPHAVGHNGRSGAQAQNAARGRT